MTYPHKQCPWRGTHMRHDWKQVPAEHPDQWVMRRCGGVTTATYVFKFARAR